MVIFLSLILVFYRTYVEIPCSFFFPPNDPSLSCARPIWTWLHNYFNCFLWWLLTPCCLSFVQVLFLANCTKSQVCVLILLVLYGTQFASNASNSCRVFFAELGGKDVEDLFTAVLSPAATQPAPLPQPPPPPQLMSLHSQGMFPLVFCEQQPGQESCAPFKCWYGSSSHLILCSSVESATVNLWNVILSLFWREYVINIHANVGNRKGQLFEIFLTYRCFYFSWHLDGLEISLW